MKLWFAVIAALLLGGLGPAQAQENPKTIQLYPGISAPPIGANVWHLVDVTGELTLDEVRARSAEFKHNAEEKINFGIAIPVKWQRLDIVNAGSQNGTWLISVRQLFTDILDIYVVRNGAAELLYSASNQAIVDHSRARYSTQAAPFSLAPAQQGTLFIRYHGVNITRLPLAISTEAYMAEARRLKHLIFGIIVASVAAFALYSCAIFMIIGGHAILYFAASEIAFLLLYAYFNGFLNIELWPNAPFRQNHIAPILNAANVIFTLLFVRNFFTLHKDAPRTDKLLGAMVYASSIFLLFMAVFALLSVQVPDIILIVPYFLTALMWYILPPLALYATLRWRVIYWPLVPAWLSVSLYNIYPLLAFMNIVPEPPFHPQWLGFSIVIQAFFLAVAIALQVKQLRDDSLLGQLALNASLQQQLASANKNAAMLREMADQGRLVQAAGHDTRSILHGLRSFAASLSQGADAGRVSHTAQEITYLTDDLEAVLSTTIASAAGGASEDIIALECVALADVLSAVRLIYERTARQKKLRLRVHAGLFERVTDRALLVRILGNLVNNACHYTTSGGVIVAARQHAGALRIQVWDSGAGIAPGLLARLLDPDTGHLRGTDASPGQGSGLRIAKALAGQLGATLGACSRPGSGSRFEIVLPLASQQRAPVGGRLWILQDDRAVAEKLLIMAQAFGVTGNCVTDRDWDCGQMAANDQLLIDMHFGGTLNGAEIAKVLAGRIPRSHIFICTFDRGVDVRARLAPVAGTILYQPVTSEALQHALTRRV